MTTDDIKAPSEGDRLAALRSPRSRYVAAWLAAGAGYAGLIALARPFLAVAWFAVLGLGAVAYRARRDDRMFDERDHRLRGRAADLTLRAVGAASAVFFPTAVVLWGLGYHDWPPWLATLGFAVAGLTGLYGVVSALVRRRG